MSLFRKKSDFNLEQVLAGCRENKPKAQRQLVEQFYSQAKRICLRYAGNLEEAEEIADDGFVKIFSNLQNFEAHRAFEPWLKTIMIRTAIDFFRKRQQVMPVGELDESYQAGKEPEGIEMLSAQELMSLIQQLPPVYRLVFNMYTIEGYDHNEIGEQLGISPSTSRANLAKARGKLQLWVKQLTEYHHNNSGKNVNTAF